MVRSVVVCATVTLAVSVPVKAQEASWRVASGEVRVVCPLTVGGSFAATTTALEGAVSADTSGGLKGTIEVDLTTLDTGIGLRNTHLRDTYLEVDRGPNFSLAVLSAITLDGVNPRTFEGETAFNALFLVHGVEHPVSGVAELARTLGEVEVTARFQAPRYLGVGVRDQVRVEVRFTALAGSGS
jgi:hypothetical protein